MLEVMSARDAALLQSINNRPPPSAAASDLEIAKAESIRKDSYLKEQQAAKNSDRLDRQELEEKYNNLCSLIDQTHDRLMNFPPEGASSCRLRLQSRLDALMEKEKKLSKQLDLNIDD